MPKKIDHEKRRSSILAKAFSVFARKGYQSTSLSSLAEECQISRPTLYLYFKDKDEIFSYAIKKYTDWMLKDYKKIAKSNSSVIEKLNTICIDIVAKAYSNIDFVQSLAGFLLHLRQKGDDITGYINRRTIGLKFLFSFLVSDGVKKGEIKDESRDSMVSQIIMILQASLLNIAFMNKIRESDQKEVLNAVSFFMKSISY